MIWDVGPVERAFGPRHFAESTDYISGGSGELDVQLAQAVGENGFVLATDASQNMVHKLFIVMNPS